MNDLESRVKLLLDRKNQSFNWLSEKIGYSRQGLKSGLINKTIKFKALEEIAEVLDVEISDLLSNSEIGSQISLDKFFENEFLKFMSLKFKSFYEKLALYKDVFVWKVLTLAVSDEDIVFPYIDPNKLSEVLPTDDKQKLSNFPVEKINKPYTQWGLTNQLEFRNEFKIIEAYHHMTFEANFYNITDLLEDGIIKDREIKRCYNMWKKL